MKTENQEQLLNDKGDSRVETLTDLPVTDEQANQTRAGANSLNGKLYLATEVGVF
jgi:hypothetical protein